MAMAFMIAWAIIVGADPADEKRCAAEHTAD